ncbi:pyruvate dehydrogenase complex dihydrolipoamide acetyltransferase [Dinghuibacter silviterrae]|uniref:Acetyltransferase component of pyruvate dehydrogenase complex n=1 Tax=Dinghuibacter silviterrae TaxID=1539049 RepID=A0A4R8DQ16_9BACT|nr:pyruvate dehydrogenase complex dihydrolipoamide acetyltransferase [Dinghuibacter silviterrae]TDX00230.1 pyruvate dehydrogenase E2 component (dihydrolipoamide acetyltransferase) [Dinghuibacter silviterrae]
MAEVIRMPLLSDTMTEGKIVQWNKKVGDKVKSDDVLADVETDKATMEVVGYADGVLLYIGVPDGQVAKVNDIIAIVGKAGEDYKPLLAGGTAPAAPAAAPATPAASAPAAGAPAVSPESLGATVIRMPLLSDTMTEGKIVTWNKKVGDTVKSDDVLADVETDKATMEVVGYAAGTLLYIGVPEGQAAKVNDIIAIVGKAGTDVTALVASLNSAPAAGGAQAAPAAGSAQAATGSAAAPAGQAAASGSASAAESDNGRLKASPLARKIAADKGISLSDVSGSGDGGRIIKRDIDQYVPAAKTAAPAAAKGGAPVPAFSAAPGAEGYTDLPNSQMRKVIARRLGESMFTAPHFYLKIEVNMDNAISARKALNEISPVKISFNDLVIKASAMALRRHPAVNASWMGDFIRQYSHVHIGSAVAIEDGLIVPVIRFADQKSLSQIASEAKDLYEKAKNKKLQPNEFSGNTFTISNLGMMDIEEFTAIINPPDSCILAVGKIEEKVVRTADGFGVINVMKLTLSCDHRSVDGAVGAAFLQTLKKFLENPVAMLA